MKILKNDRVFYINNKESVIIVTSTDETIDIISAACGVSLDVNNFDTIRISAANMMPLEPNSRYTVINSIVKEVK